MYDIIFDKYNENTNIIRFGVKILISIIAPYGYYWFYQETEKNQATDRYDYVAEYKPLREKDHIYLELAEQFFKDINFSVIDRSLLKEPVSNVTLQLRESDVQVGHCLFDDNAGEY